MHNFYISKLINSRDARSHNADPYTNIDVIHNDSEDGVGYTGYICIDNSGVKHCASAFLSKLIVSGDLKGSCAQNPSTIYRAGQLPGSC